ncbi:hypothetical protein IWX49DRAFT_566084 [Phyllosticta citricarpa]
MFAVRFQKLQRAHAAWLNPFVWMCWFHAALGQDVSSAGARLLQRQKRTQAGREAEGRDGIRWSPVLYQPAKLINCRKWNHDPRRGGPSVDDPPARSSVTPDPSRQGWPVFSIRGGEAAVVERCAGGGAPREDGVWAARLR